MGQCELLSAECVYDKHSLYENNQAYNLKDDLGIKAIKYGFLSLVKKQGVYCFTVQKQNGEATLKHAVLNNYHLTIITVWIYKAAFSPAFLGNMDTISNLMLSAQVKQCVYRRLALQHVLDTIKFNGNEELFDLNRLCKTLLFYRIGHFKPVYP